LEEGMITSKVTARYHSDRKGPIRATIGEKPGFCLWAVFRLPVHIREYFERRPRGRASSETEDADR
jgi:hypothetical protein